MTRRPDLVLSDVSKTFGRQHVVRHVSLEVPEGSYVALMGANGAGKTTLLRMASGLAVPTSGSITLAGVDMRRAGPGLRRMIGFASHDGLLYGDLTTRDNLLFHARMFGVADPEGALDELTDTLDLGPVLDKPSAILSRGNRQRVTLARALMHDPDVLFLDEPFTGLDEVSTQRLVHLLNGLHAEGRTLVMITHDVARTTDGPERLVVLDRGQVVTDEPLARLAAAPAPAALAAALVSVPDDEGALLGGTTRTLTAPPSDPASGARDGGTPPAEPVVRPRRALAPAPGRWRSAWLVALKDLRVEARSRDVLGAGGLFSLVVLITASFTSPTGGGQAGMATGVLWISLLFAVLLGVGRTMARETQDRAIEGLLLAPAPRDSIFIGKALAGLVMMAAIEVFVVPAFLVLMSNGSLGPDGPLPLLLTVVLATLGLVIVATLFSGIAVGSRLGESLLPLIVMPVVIPLMIAAVETTRRALGAVPDTGGGEMLQFYLLLAGFDLIVGLAAVATFSFVVEE